jgi:inorganic triphosphatase YgiF
MQRAIAFRLRRVGYHWVQTLKAEARAVGALSSRPEWEMAVAGSEPDFAVMPAEAMALLAKIDLSRLAPVFVTEFQRTTWLIQSGGCVAELALDSGAIRAGEAGQPISEVEIELKSGSPEGLFGLARTLLDELPLRVEPRSKAERGYLLCEAISPEPVRAARPAIRPDQAASDAWMAVTRAALVQLVANVPGFLEHSEEIEYLHQLRIALRRLRAAVGLGKSLGMARPAWSQALGEIMRGLNPARDWDVFLHETLPSVEAVLADAPVGEDLLNRARQATLQARLAAQESVASPAFTRLVLDIGESLHASPRDGMRAADWAASLLDDRWKKLRGLCKKLSDLGPGGRHEVRIAAKKLRYAADALEGMYGKRGRNFIKRLAELQDSLGRANDAYIASRLLEDLRPRNMALAYDAGRICGVMTERFTHHGTACDSVWQRMAKARVFWR